MDETKINQTAELLKVIGNTTRLKILVMLASQGSRNCTYLQEQLQLEQSLVSHHLTKLKDKGILIGQRKGKEMHYEVNNLLVRELTHLLTDRVGNSPATS